MPDRRIDLSIIDLDAVADLIRARRHHWHALGLTTHDLTWTADTDAWPVILQTDRSAIARPRSLGVRMTKTPTTPTDMIEAEVVIYAGGWLDADWVVHDQATSKYIELDTPQDCANFLDTLAAHLTMLEVPAENLTLGDVVELGTQPVPTLIRLTLIRPRTNGYKIEGRGPGGSLHSSSFAYGTMVRRFLG